MTTIQALAALAFCALAACAAETGAQRGPVARAALPAPELSATREADGTCRAREVIPAIYEHVMGEVQVVQAEIAEDGTVIRPPIYRKAPVPRIVRPRGEMSFEAPCPEQQTPDFVASLQRALAARNYFSGNVTGVMDAPTVAALRRYQSERGLDSGQVSLETARALGLVAVEIDPA